MDDLYLLEIEIKKLERDINRCPTGIKNNIVADLQLLQEAIDLSENECNNI